MAPNPLNDATACLRKIEAELNTDILVYSGDIGVNGEDTLVRSCRRRKGRESVLLILITSGGDPDAGYRIARFLQGKYKNFRLLVPGRCKSAGTLIALGASELIFSDFGELGPLDVQLMKADELFETSSGLNVMSALSSLQLKSFEAFEDYFLKLKMNYGLTTKTSAEIAANLTKGMFSPIYEQVDPMHVGEVGRSMGIAQSYGAKLNVKSKNLKEDTLTTLIAGYPSHGYVIDREEAVTLFHRVRASSQEEDRLYDYLEGQLNLSAITKKNGPTVWFVDEIFSFLQANLARDNKEAEEHEQRNQSANGSPSTDEEPRPESLARKVERNVQARTDAEKTARHSKDSSGSDTSTTRT